MYFLSGFTLAGAYFLWQYFNCNDEEYVIDIASIIIMVFLFILGPLFLIAILMIVAIFVVATFAVKGIEKLENVKIRVKTI